MIDKCMPDVATALAGITDGAVILIAQGARDLTKRLWVAMEHITKSHGGSRIRRACSYPLTAKGVVRRVYTGLAVLDVTPRGFCVIDMVPGTSREALQERSEAELHWP